MQITSHAWKMTRLPQQKICWLLSRWHEQYIHPFPCWAPFMCVGVCVPFEVVQQREEGHDVGLRQGAQEVHHAVLLSCGVWESCVWGGTKKRCNYGKGALEPRINWWGKNANVMTRTVLLGLKSHRCLPWKPGRGGRWAEAPAAPWSKAWAFLRWHWCPCHSASWEYLWYLRGRIREESRCGKDQTKPKTNSALKNICWANAA